MKFLVDVNVVLDVLLDRAPHAVAAARLWAAVEKEQVEALVPAHGLTTIFYLATRHRDRAFARRIVGEIMVVFGIAPVDERVLRRALTLPCPDFEDAVCAAAAEASGCDGIVTRDPGGFPRSPVPLVDPLAAVALLNREDPGGVAEPQPRDRRKRRGRERPRRATGRT